ncbi:modular serine protease-like isoform X1 [Lucilia sericata]|uniref:modular serine protease-like isoform X1 n=1 Tax=Lucilia sericata TaxID=13632 RepID=UPI0018A80EE6|nr:modular serine protease-like isoform X1 [Lucilia sericata]
MRISKNVYQYFIQIIVISLCLTNFYGARSQCSYNDWACDNGQCIPDDKLCDGKVDCRDRSDEIAENCIQFHESCPKYAFRCAYGACIDGKTRCNGVQDCADNSDELICIKKDDSDFQNICSDTEIQCVNSKECINSINLCNGRVDCKDGSDESLELCINFGCISYGFQCGYGACISGNAKCNGVKECADGSDEAWELCNTPRKTTNNIGGVTPTPIPKPTPTPTPAQFTRCIIPNIPQLQDLVFKLHPENGTIPIGSFVDDFDIIHMECQNKYTLRGQSSLLCQNGKWNFDFPSCVGYCDGTLLRGLSVRAVCDYRTHFKDCPKRIRPGTEIQLNCNFGFIRNPDVPQYIKCLSDGTFDKSPLPCELHCGRVSPNSEPLSKRGVPIKASTAPWHVSIHENNSVYYDYICSGSIVSPRVIVTAAHCFWDQPTLTLRNYTEYQIIAGSNTSNYTTEQNEYLQVVQVEEIHIPVDYRGKNGRQRDDIAFLKLKTGLRFSETIASICMPNQIRNSASNYILSNQPGFMTGFGLNNHLERLNMLTLDYNECYKKSVNDAPIADDKFCIINKEGASVCRGDSGAGFFTENRNLDNEIIYRLLGVISNTPTTRNDCTLVDDDAYVAITNIHYMTSEFKKKLFDAINEDRPLF